MLAEVCAWKAADYRIAETRCLLSVPQPATHGEKDLKLFLTRNG
jgi:hypothetical protein